MKGLITKTAACLALALGLGVLTGCVCYRNLVDPCWPERYNHAARQTVRDVFNEQGNNGHIIDQTVWNYMFEVDPKTGNPTERLAPAGMAHLNYLIRRRPSPDPKVFLQTAQDIPGFGFMPVDKAAAARADLDNRRVQSIQNYLAMQMAGRTHAVAFDIAVHDPAPVGLAALPIVGAKRADPTGSIPRLYENFQGLMNIQFTINTTGGGGGGSGGGGGGGGN